MAELAVDRATHITPATNTKCLTNRVTLWCTLFKGFEQIGVETLQIR